MNCSLHSFKGVIARDHHSLAYTSNEIYAWGMNVGQFGFPADDAKIIHPRRVTFLLIE